MAVVGALQNRRVWPTGCGYGYGGGFWLHELKRLPSCFCDDVNETDLRRCVGLYVPYRAAQRPFLGKFSIFVENF